MAHYGRFRLANARTTGAKALSDEFDCDKARFVLIQANSGQVDVAVHRGPDDADAGTLVGQFILKGNGDSCIIEKHPTDVLVFNTCSASKVSNIA